MVDNNSRDGTRNAVEEFAGSSGLNVRYLFEPRPGKSHALNAGIKAAEGEIIAMTDDDVIVGKDWLSELNNAFEEFNCLGVAGRINALWPCPKPTWFSDEGPYKLPNAIVSFEQGEQPCVLRFAPLGANLALRKVAFDKYGLFRTDLGPQEGSLIRGEDTEFFHRLRNQEERFVYVPRAIVYHPVERGRVRKQYYRAWSFGDGRFRARLDKIPEGAVYYFGAPRYLFRDLFDKALRCFLSFKTKKRFYYELRVWWLAGQIFETRRLTKTTEDHLPVR